MLPILQRGIRLLLLLVTCSRAGAPRRPFLSHFPLLHFALLRFPLLHFPLTRTLLVVPVAKCRLVLVLVRRRRRVATCFLEVRQRLDGDFTVRKASSFFKKRPGYPESPPGMTPGTCKSRTTPVIVSLAATPPWRANESPGRRRQHEDIPI